MSASVAWADVEVGTELPPLSVSLQRVNLVMYAGASGDFNPIHWNQRFATAVGLPDVIAHGMLTMASAGRVVTDWVGDPGAVVEYGVRFTRPVTAGDRLVVVTTIEAIRVAAGNDILTTRSDISTVDGEPVVTAWSVTVARGTAEESA